ncbi:MAG: Crp/Fnr family transcriptional regulator [Croceimicrobium sp.]|nr:Crp/Fnr family transcriptional regulator [Bacteroidota bacterium]
MDAIENIIKQEPKSSLKHFKKGDIIQFSKSTNAQAFYVKKGLLRSYISDSDGKEHIYMFAPEGWIIGDIEAIGYEQETELIIDCLEDSEVIVFDKHGLFNQRLDKQQLIENVGLLTRRVGRLQRRVLMLMGAPAADRYKYFLKIYPDLNNRIPQKMIASYLGIAPQTLSTIRGKIARH